MNYTDYLSFLNRFKYFILISCIAFSLIAFGYSKITNKPKVSTGIFVSFAVINADQNSGQSTTYDNLQASDFFTETVQGWFKNPNLINRINDEAGVNAGLSAKKQEKQNLVISFDTDNKTDADKIISAIKENLQNEISQYNEASNTDFSIAIYNFETNPKANNTNLLILIGLIIGLTVSIIVSILITIYKKVLISKKQIKKIFGQKIIEEYSSSKKLSVHKDYLNEYLKKINQKKNLNFMFLNKEKEKLTKIFGKNNTSKITDLNTENFNIIITELGYTKISELEKIKKLNLSQFEIILLNAE